MSAAIRGFGDPIPPAELTRFEKLVTRLGLVEAEFAQNSTVITWVKLHAGEYYVPEELLNALGIRLGDTAVWDGAGTVPVVMKGERRGRPPIAMIGKRFGFLVVRSQAIGRARSTNAFWRCVCDCGATVTVCGAALRQGQRSCSRGCTARRTTRAQVSPKNLPIPCESNAPHPCPA